MQKILSILCFLLSLQLFSQNVKGKVYDDEATVSGAKVINRTQNILTYTDTNGTFELEASIGDSIAFISLFHHQKSIVLKKADFDDVLVIELKKSVNDLDEVYIKKEPDVKPFDPVETNTTLKNQILEDIKNNPHLYGKTPSGGVDFVALAGLIGKLFKSKKPKEPGLTFAVYNEIVQLFETDSYFNDKFLKNELKIEEDYKYLFFQFCETKEIDSKLLKVENRFLLLDTLLKCSNDFLQIIESDQKD